MASSSSASASGTWFDGLKRNWAAVKTEPGIDTAEFIEASQSLVTLFDLLGPTAFGTVISDMNGNIKKINDRYTAAPNQSGTIQALVHEESKEKGKKASATEGLLWLTRGLEFTAKAIRHNVDNPTEELATSFQHSYDGTLKKHHNFVVKGLFTVALKATPYRKDFYEKLGGTKEVIDGQLTTWLENLEKVTQIIQDEYAKNNNFGF